MLDAFSTHIQENRLCNKNESLLLAISGGIDSVVMLDLFYRAGYTCFIAHCNFQLRGTESDDDEAFVKDLGRKYDIPVHTHSFNTLEYAGSNNISVQMAARELRYEWFEEIRIQTGCDYIATAHNKNDIVETFFINLSRGTGIRGLAGIREKSGFLIRPMLFSGRDRIASYAIDRNLEWREDSSNAGTKYARNKIRHGVIPVLEEINPRLNDIMLENIARLKEAGEIYADAIETKKQELLIRDKRYLLINLRKLVTEKFARTWLYEILADFNFTSAVVDDIMKSLQGEPGKIFISPTHRLVKDREALIIEPLRPEHPKRYYIENPYLNIDEPLKLSFSVLDNSVDFVIPRYPDIACLDFDKLVFPLILRKWEKGDYFMPLGMKNMKKLSDFFVDTKMSIPEKESTWLLTSGKDIVWVIGKRIDERFRIAGDTEKILQIEIL